MRFLKWFWLHKKISVVLIIIIAGFIFISRRNSGAKLEEGTIARGEVDEELIISGSVIADEDAKLTFATSGQINYIGVKEGDEVKKGKLLASIDSTSLNSTYQEALSDLRAEEANVAEVHDNLKNNDTDETFAQKNTRTAAEVKKDKAYEAVQIAQFNLKNSKLYAPFDGLVTYVANPFVGISVLYTQTQVELINPNTIHFEVDADQSEVVDIHVGDKVKITLDALDNQEFTGVVQTVSYAPTPDAVGSVYGVRVNFENLNNNDFTYRVGMTGDAHFILNKKENVLYVPPTFVKSDDNGDYLLTNSGKDKVYVKVGLEGEERTEVSGDGLTEGMKIYD